MADTSTVPNSYDTYAVDRSDPRFTDWLRARSEPAWTAAVDHRFVRELAKGTLADEVFRRYLVQDRAFVDTLAAAFGYAVGQAPDTEARARLVEFLVTLTGDENDYFERSFEALDVPERVSRDPDLTPTTRAFQDHLYRAVERGGYAETLAVLVPAEWVYLSWASGVGDRPDEFYLAEWVDLHATDAFADFVGWLRRELDAHGEAAGPDRQRRVARLFARTVDLEVAFFEAAYAPRTAPGDWQGAGTGGGS